MKNSPSNLFKQLVIVHLALTIGTILVVGVMYTLKVNSEEVISSKNGNNILELVVPVVALLFFAAAYYIGKRKYKLMSSSDSLLAKLDVYRRNNILVWASLEGSAFFAAIAFYTTGRTNLLLYGVMLSVLLLYFRPLKSRAAEELKLSGDEIEELNE